MHPIVGVYDDNYLPKNNFKGFQDFVGLIGHGKDRWFVDWEGGALFWIIMMWEDPSRWIWANKTLCSFWLNTIQFFTMYILYPLKKFIPRNLRIITFCYFPLGISFSSYFLMKKLFYVPNTYYKVLCFFHYSIPSQDYNFCLWVKSS